MKVAADDEGFGKPVGLRLFGIGQFEPEFRTVPQQLAKNRQVAWRRDDKNLANSGEHQYAQRIVDHRLVMYR